MDRQIKSIMGNNSSGETYRPPKPKQRRHPKALKEALKAQASYHSDQERLKQEKIDKMIRLLNKQSIPDIMLEAGKEGFRRAVVEVDVQEDVDTTKLLEYLGAEYGVCGLQRVTNGIMIQW